MHPFLIPSAFSFSNLFSCLVYGQELFLADKIVIFSYRNNLEITGTRGENNSPHERQEQGIFLDSI